MEKIEHNGSNYFITFKKKFSPLGVFKIKTIETVFDFAYNMTFGNSGEHRDHRTGGTHQRRKGEIFANTFQGKLAECAIYNQLYRDVDISKPDFATYGLGAWDAADFFIGDNKVSIKSTKAFGNLLLLETKDWNANGIYIPNNEAYDYTFLVRMNPYCEDILKRSRMLYADSAEYTALKNIVCSEKWEYDIPGFVTLEELKYIIRNGFIIPQNAMLNAKTRMDAENYYVQSGDMHDIQEFGAMIHE